MKIPSDETLATRIDDARHRTVQRRTVNVFVASSVHVLSGKVKG